MGMSASQARFLALTARKNNVEFCGQQINQQRTALSNQSASYYSELCNMVVPTPPSVDDYTKVTYSFDDGALSNTITTMVASKTAGEYTVSYIQQWQDDYSIVSASSSVITKEDSKDGNSKIYKVGSTQLVKIGGAQTSTNGGTTYSKDIALEADREKYDPYYASLDTDQRKELIAQENEYISMLQEKTGDKNQTTWYVKYIKDTTSGAYVPNFYNATELAEDKYYNDGIAMKNMNCYSLGSTTQTKEVLNRKAIIEKDTTGRYISIKFYEMDDNGDRVEQDEYNLTTNTHTDDDAYNDAMNNYTYEQYRYNQKIQDINSQIEIIQQQDKSLELKLKQLDTEENAINTEIDAVKQVLKKNVESSFKTFNG